LLKIKQMKKTVTFNNIEFVFLVELNYKIERRLGGKKFHRLLVMSKNYHRQYDIDDVDLAADIALAEKEAQDFAQGKETIDEAVFAFQALGFEKIS
jgi:hypothetical protein